MHTTTVRFSGETWTQLKEVCERDGIATAQYIREATIARLAQSARLPQVERQDRELDELRGRVERIERALQRRIPR
ncbi:hypothetical protein [Conexibacter sp. CPCC 206217]|uniref:hypothetical protein n=1 Tax=Conexibacter sp. CPCC 206217 TaxID=3064574 RepID=UPI0027173333|nr:hypothetical protein [Conexibacter sp. CPCC 206217]MDO8209865.1 hypothetical protein [Conexibacter sp. CPCC 206217]